MYVVLEMQKRGRLRREYCKRVSFEKGFEGGHETGDSTFSLWWAARDPIMH